MPNEATPLTRRRVLRNGVLTGLGAAAVAIASPAFTGKAQAQGVQSGWEWCNLCKGLFYGPQTATSVCPVGGTHIGWEPVQSYDYFLNYNIAPGQQSFQYDWNWCRKCRGLFYGPQVSSSYCPDGGTHDGAGSYNYSVIYGAVTLTSGLQQYWRWCRNCKGMFYGPQASKSWCPFGQPHDGSGSYDYWMSIYAT